MSELEVSGHNTRELLIHLKDELGKALVDMKYSKNYISCEKEFSCCFDGKVTYDYRVVANHYLYDNNTRESMCINLYNKIHSEKILNEWVNFATINSDITHSNELDINEIRYMALKQVEKSIKGIEWRYRAKKVLEALVLLGIVFVVSKCIGLIT